MDATLPLKSLPDADEELVPREIVVSGPETITHDELARLQTWLAHQFIVENPS